LAIVSLARCPIKFIKTLISLAVTAMDDFLVQILMLVVIALILSAIVLPIIALVVLACVTCRDHPNDIATYLPRGI